jgi:hypothetical protein
MTTIAKGTKVIFTPTGAEFELKTVTDKNVVWYVGFNFKSGSGINNLKTASTSRKIFEDGIAKGTYKII